MLEVIGGLYVDVDVGFIGGFFSDLTGYLEISLLVILVLIADILFSILKWIIP